MPLMTPQDPLAGTNDVARCATAFNLALLATHMQQVMLVLILLCRLCRFSPLQRI
jgi:hypothetical protein